jgi:hypothetical protein
MPACGHHRLSDFCLGDLVTWNESMAKLTAGAFAGASR